MYTVPHLILVPPLFFCKSSLSCQSSALRGIFTDSIHFLATTPLPVSFPPPCPAWSIHEHPSGLSSNAGFSGAHCGSLLESCIPPQCAHLMVPLILFLCSQCLAWCLAHGCGGSQQCTGHLTMFWALINPYSIPVGFVYACPHLEIRKQKFGRS